MFPKPSLLDKLFILNVLKPKASPFPLVRVGGSSDGAYLIPDDIHGISRCFSPGCMNQKDFEDDLSTRYDVPCHICDYSSSESDLATPLLANQTFEKVWLTPASFSNTEVTLQDWVDFHSDISENDMLLQMDIEGFEYSCLLLTPISILARFRILVLEFHSLQQIESDDIRESVLLPLFKKLDGLFTCVHLHPNNCSGSVWVSGTSVQLPMTLEVTFLRKDRFNPDGTQFLPALPHPLDIINVPDKPPVFLSDFWRGKRLAIPSLMDKIQFKLRMLNKSSFVD